MDFLKKHIGLMETYLASSGVKGSPSSLYDPIDYIISIGGKRVRPALVMMSYELFDDKLEKALPAAYSLELFHNFTLMHDDIMDAATLRRGHQTVHHKYDTSSAILSGDVMLVYCYQKLMEYSSEVALPLMHSFNDMAIKLCEGQSMDMDFEKRDNVQIDDYLKMIENKTAVLIACALQFGAILTCQADDIQKGLYEFGRNIGIAFQIHDDILDSFGNEEEVGKKPCGDILQNKKTYIYLKAAQLADVKQLEKLNHYYAHTDFDENEKIEVVRNIFTSTGALEYSNQLRDAYYDLAISHLKALGLEEAKEALLIQFAQYLIKRTK
jgi:geranylgeranyl diphosphate synthase, type II